MWDLGYKKTEHQEIDAFELWCWRRLLRIPCTARISNQSILKEINSEYSLEGLMLKLKLQYFSHLMGRADSLEETLMLGKIEGRRRGWQRIRWLDCITDLMGMSLSKLQELVGTGKPGVLLSMGLQRVAHDWAPELNWTLSWHLVFHHPLGEKNGNPLQYSRLENAIDRGAWQATVYRIAKSWTQLKQLDRHTYIQTHIRVYIAFWELFIPCNRTPVGLRNDKSPIQESQQPHHFTEYLRNSANSAFKFHY